MSLTRPCKLCRASLWAWVILQPPSAAAASRVDRFQRRSGVLSSGSLWGRCERCLVRRNAARIPSAISGAKVTLATVTGGTSDGGLVVAAS